MLTESVYKLPIKISKILLNQHFKAMESFKMRYYTLRLHSKNFQKQRLYPLAKKLQTIKTIGEMAKLLPVVQKGFFAKS